MMVEAELVSMISQVGFPIAVTVWLLFSSKKTDVVIQNNTAALGEIKGIILNCVKK
jgi:hypothetical protein